MEQIAALPDVRIDGAYQVVVHEMDSDLVQLARKTALAEQVIKISNALINISNALVTSRIRPLSTPAAAKADTL